MVDVADAGGAGRQDGVVQGADLEALAEALHGQGAEPVFATRTSDGGYLGAITDKGFGLIPIPPGLPPEKEPAALAREGASRVVVDRYGLPDGYAREVKRGRPDCAVLWIDDLGEPSSGADRATLAFLCESAGFSDVEILRLSPVPDPERLPLPAPGDEPLARHVDRLAEQLNGVIYGWQDYAVLARR